MDGRPRLPSTRMPSWPRGIAPRAPHRSGLDTLASSGSCHRTKAAAFRRELETPPVASWLAPNGDDLPPSLHEHYTRFVTTTGQSAPLRRIGTFGLAVGAACALYGAFGVKQRSIISTSFFLSSHPFVRPGRSSLRPDPQFAHAGARRSCQGWPSHQPYGM